MGGAGGGEEEAERIAEAGGSFLTPEDAAYPERLLEIYDPPAVLWVRGDAALLARPGIAVVGTRQPSPYGAGMAEMLCARSGEAGDGDHERHGAGCGYGGAQGRARGGRKDGGGVGNGHRCGLSEGEQEAGGEDCGAGRERL